MTPLGRAAKRRILAASALVGAMLSSAPCCFASDFVFIRSGRGASAEQQQTESAVRFYGFDLKVVTAGSAAGESSIRAAVEEKETVGVAIDAGALSAVDQATLLRALRRNTGRDVPLLIVGVTPDLSPALLKRWSGGDVTGSTRIEPSPSLQYKFGPIDDVTRQLASIEAPYSVTTASYFVLGGKGKTQPIESVQDGGKSFPVFIESAIGDQTVFLANALQEDRNVPNGQDVVSAFLGMAPEMIFVRYSAGDRAWHSLHHYANFTIDDPWLREPYGYVDYQGLFNEMEKHHFHTTIAFIPWNYERSQPQVVSLFRDHPDRFSIAVHGNDHDHKEFTDYRSKPLADQIGDLKQGLARMERFQALTRIPYDKVMIFPHSIAPEQTLGALKTYNYLATVNSSNIPQNSTGPTELSDVLRPVTLSFEGIPSISRYSAEVPVSDAYVAIHQFLGNPLFFYDHSNLFSKGIDAFDPVADKVNKLEPATEWRNLGEIVRHLYLIRLRDDLNYDVLAYSNNFIVENTADRSAIFYIAKPEVGGQPIASVSVDGKLHPYVLQDGKISLSITIPPGGVSGVAVQYANDLQVNPANPAHDSFVVYLLRMGSDFRDIYLAKSAVGLAFIRYYNEHELKPAQVLGCLLLLFVLAIYAIYRVRVSSRRRLPANQDRPVQLTK